MSDESEEACLVGQRSTSLSGISAGIMPYTDGVQQHHHQQQQQQQQQMQQNAQNNSGRSSASQNSHESESGELIDYNDEVLLSQFHADAIKQAGCGKFQIIASIITGFGLAGHAIQVYSVFYIMPSAEIEFCIMDNEKNWLSNITFLGLGFGALIWGGLAGRTGRRKALLSCLGVSTVFSVIAAFMPTYGPFMMARFCAAAGIGGALPSAASYLCEITPLCNRTRILSLLGACGVAGGILCGAVALVTVPLTGQMVAQENKEHFSAWHRYLLLIILPTLVAILGLFWLPESPRYLLESGREVEALQIYQRIYRSNRSRSGYTLTELELPGARGQRNVTPPASVLAGMAHSVNMYCGSFFQMFNKRYTRSTWLFLVAWTVATFVFHGLTVYISEHTKAAETMRYNHETVFTVNTTFRYVNFNQSLDNLVFNHCTFLNCTFERIFISHVEFNNCSFRETEFANVKTSRTKFHDCILDDVKLIDTDLTDRHFVNSITNNTEVVRLSGTCDRDFEYNIYLDAVWRSNLGALIPAMLATILVGEAVQQLGRTRIASACFALSICLCIVLSFLYDDNHVIWTGGCAQGLILAGLAALTLLTIEIYTTPLRCTALGLFMCVGHIGALLSSPVYILMPTVTVKFAAITSAVIMLIPTISSGMLKDPCVLL